MRGGGGGGGGGGEVGSTINIVPMMLYGHYSN